MGVDPAFDRSGKKLSRWIFPVVLLMQTLAANSFALPRRLVLALDGISYRDMKALQEGVSYTDARHRQFHRRAFTDGFFPVSRNISTFPSTSDVAWTDIFGDRPLPGYQRTYFSEAENRQIAGSSLTISMEHERQMHWQAESAYLRAMAYLYPLHTFKYELRQMTRAFLDSKEDGGNYYVYLRSTDDAQHTAGDIFSMLCLLDESLERLRAAYKAREGRNLEILILSDHGNNRAGAGKRVAIRPFLTDAGYHLTRSLHDSRDVVLPTCGIESWVEIHNAPAETERLSKLLLRLEGVDLVTARAPGQTNRVLVLNPKGERATIEWNPANNAYRYSPEAGDPLNYRPVVEALAKKNRLDANGFATADDWMAQTLTNRYPLAPERIFRGLTCITLNPATIILSLSNGYVHDGWLIHESSRLVTQGGTHGNLDDLNSDGIVLSNFTPTRDTSTGRVAALFDDFNGLINYRTEENGAEWVTGEEQALTRIARVPFDSACHALPGDATFLRVWTPEFAHLDRDAPVEVTFKKTKRFAVARVHRWDPASDAKASRRMILTLPVAPADQCACERVYALPSGFALEPRRSYRVSGCITGREKPASVFDFAFRTDDFGKPVAY